MLRGKSDLRSDDLLRRFDWPSPDAAFAGSGLPTYMRDVIGAMGTEERLQLPEWCTGMSALPCGELKQKVRLCVYEGACDGDLPEVHTCTYEIHLPRYSCCEQLRSKLMLAVEHRGDGFHNE